MTILFTRLRAVLLFYRSVAPFMLFISALILWCVLRPALLEGWARGGILLQLVLIKLMTGPVVWYLAERMRPNQYWFYYNLGVSRRFLWGGVAVVDGLLFSGLMLALNACYA